MGSQGALSAKVAIITGAGRGIGRSMALHMAREGARVVVNDLGGEVDGSGAGRIADHVVKEIRDAGGEAAANYDTVATLEGGERIFQTALDSFGRCDVLVNNAGILRDKTIFNMEEEDWDKVLAVHLRGHYCCTRPFARYIRDQKQPGKRVINFSSVSGLYGNFGQSNYGAAKAGIAGFSRVLALELVKYGGTSNVISPGAATRMTIPLMQGRGQGDAAEDPMRGPDPIAPVVTWLASDRSQHVTGQIFHVGRGLVGIMQQPRVIRSFKTEHIWELDELDRVMPVLLDAKKAHDERVEKDGEPEPV
jgi:NAD(P)-dependent dehydrogenase (short-subunit alcohol dehydrogenase family)